MSSTAYIRYDQSGRIVPGGPFLFNHKPIFGNWQVVELGTASTLEGELSAYVRLDKLNNPIPASLLLARTKPIVGEWLQIDAAYK